MSMTPSTVAIPFPGDASERATLPLGRAPIGFRGRVEGICASQISTGRPATELEMRLIEIGFIEGARVELLHQGIFGRDPIAVRVNDATIALRRSEAMAVSVRPLEVDS